MTRIIRKEIVNGKSTNNIITGESDKVIFYDNREISEIDYTETTAQNNFCGIRFKGSNVQFWIPSWRLDMEGEK